MRTRIEVERQTVTSAPYETVMGSRWSRVYQTRLRTRLVTGLMDQRPDGVHLSYDTMESLLAPYGCAEALEVARSLDEKVMALLTQGRRPTWAGQLHGKIALVTWWRTRTQRDVPRH
jgi:hypothetical protein